MKQITALNQTVPARESLQYLQSTFLQNVRHELRTPLTIILGYVELLRAGELGTMDADQQRAILAIANSAHELRKVIERISTLLLAQARTIPFQRLNLAQVVETVLEIYRPKAKAVGLVLEFCPPPTALEVYGDFDQLCHAVECLTENGLKFTPVGGSVILQITADRDWVYLDVEDSGIGIAPDKLDYIFTPFYQIDGSTRRRYGGLGLGLTVAKTVVEAHAGQLEVASQPGQGSRFTMKLPELTRAPSLNQPVEVNPPRQRVLVVDDEKYITLMLKEALEELPNCEIMTASSGDQALELFKAHTFDMLITDYRMPGTDGLALATHVGHLYPQTTIIMLTAYSTASLLEQAACIPIEQVLSKPVKLKEIRQLVARVLGRDGSDGASAADHLVGPPDNPAHPLIDRSKEAGSGLACQK